MLNESETLEMGNDEIAIIGVENWGNPPFKQYGNLKKAMDNVKDVNFKILLSHDPSHWEEEVANKTDIFLTLSSPDPSRGCCPPGCASHCPWTAGSGSPPHKWSRRHRYPCRRAWCWYPV